MSAKVGQGWRRAFAPYTTNDNQNNLRISAGRGAVINAVGQTQLQAQVLENQQDVQNRDFAYYQLRATREALEGIRKVAKKLSKDVVELPGKVIVNHNELLKQESFQNELALIHRERKVNQLMQKYSQKSEKSDGSIQIQGKQASTDKLVVYANSEDAINKLIEECKSTNEDVHEALIELLSKKFPGKEIITCPDNAIMAERIAQETGLAESFPTFKEVLDKRDLIKNSKENYESVFYSNILNGIKLAVFPPKNSQVIDSLKSLKLSKVLTRVELIEGKKIIDSESLFLSRVVIHQAIKVTHKYSLAAFQVSNGEFEDLKKGAWTSRKIIQLATTNL